MIAAICVIAAILFLARMWWMQPSMQLSRVLRNCSSQADGSIDDFSDITPFRWQRMFVVSPYTSHQQIESSLGFKWPAVTSTSINSNDGVNLLVFTYDNKVACWLEHSRDSGDFEPANDVQVYDANDSDFELDVDPTGWSTFRKIGAKVAEQGAQSEPRLSRI
jgi:hypothetical protein